MEKRVALIGIVVEDMNNVESLNHIYTNMATISSDVWEFLIAAEGFLSSAWLWMRR